MTKQWYYDELVRRSAEGLFPAVGTAGCAYRATSGLKCAIGVLIPDSDYEVGWENHDFAGVASQFGKPAWWPEWLQWSEDESSSAYQLQLCHDELSGGWSHRKFVERLNRLALFADVEKVSAA